MSPAAEVGPVRAATDAELVQAAAEVVRQASREVRLVTRGDVLAELLGSGILASVTAASAPVENRDAKVDNLGGVAAERADSSGDAPGKSAPSSQGDGIARLVADGDRDAWLAAVLSGHPGISSFESLSGQTVYHAPDLLSRTYALILDRKGAPMELVAEEIRANCRDYPRPVPVELFEAAPFELSPEEIGSVLKAMASSTKCKDITFTTASTGAVYLFSTLHMDREYATFLAERAETLSMNP